MASRPGTLSQLLDIALPLLIAARCPFKIVAEASLLQAFNDGRYGLGAVGKAVTVYPPHNAIVSLGMTLADALAGFDAPRINSDLQIRPGSPVFYRFGPISARVRSDDWGRIDVIVETPEGAVESGLAGSSYVLPAGIDDPFAELAIASDCLPRLNGAIVIGDHYTINGAIDRTHRGTTYRATDTRNGERVIVKEARAFINENAEGDARSYLRNERRILATLADVGSVPRLRDYFRYGADEYLVLTDLGGTDLRVDILDNGLFTTIGHGQRSLRVLGKALISILDEVHARGVVYRDLAPKNVIAMGGGKFGLVDFELSRLDGVQRFGWSTGYSRSNQRAHASAAMEDDYFSLGATLFNAVTGLDPLTSEDGQTVSVLRTLACLKSVCEDGNVVTLVADLMAKEPARQSFACDLLRADQLRPSPPSKPARRHGRVPIDAILDQCRNTARADAAAMLDHIAVPSELPPPLVAQSGLAGLVAELSLHPSTVDIASKLAGRLAPMALSISMPPSLMFGRTGIALSLLAAATASGDKDLSKMARIVLPDKNAILDEARMDVSHGLAGIGIGLLAIAEQATEADHCLELVNLCATRLRDGQNTVEQQLNALPKGRVAHGISIADGFSHGRSGIAYFLMAHSERCGSQASRALAHALLVSLVTKANLLAAKARTRHARPMCASWCQGLAGIGAVLLRGFVSYGDPAFLEGARRAADGCIAIAPRVPLVTQCCGLAGACELMLDLSQVDDNRHYRRLALELVDLILIRGSGTRSAPLFPSARGSGQAPGWGTGTVGLLSLMRRMVDPASPRLWMAAGRLEQLSCVSKLPIAVGSS